MAFAAAAPALADTAPDELIRQVSTEVIDTVKSDKAIQAGDVSRIVTLVDTKVMPHVNFQRMTASAVGRNWRSATPEQQKRLQEEFKILLVRSYAGALTQVKDQTVQLKPMRAKPGDTEVVVRTEVKGKGEPIQLDYRLEKAGDTLEDLRRQRASACGWSSSTATLVQPGDQRRRHRRPDRQAGRAQQGRGRRADMKLPPTPDARQCRGGAGHAARRCSTAARARWPSTRRR